MMTKQEITGKLIGLLAEFTESWGLDGEISSETRLNEDLCFSSVDVLHYLAVIDMNFQKKFPFETLIMLQGAYRKELTVAELADFIFEHRNIADREPKPM